MIDWLTFRILYAMEDEARAWVIHPSPFPGGKFIATDECRFIRFNPNDGGKVANGVVERSDFKTFGEAQRYTHYRAVRAGVIHALCFWRKDA